MRSLKRLLCFALALTLALFGALAEDAAEEPAPEKAPEQVEAAPEEPEEEKPAEAKEAPEAEPAKEADPEPAAEAPEEQESSDTETPKSDEETPPEPSAEDDATEPAPEPETETPAETTVEAASEPTAEPTPAPTESPTTEPTPAPTEAPVAETTPAPVETAAPEPTEGPSPEPTEAPTDEPTVEPTLEPTLEPTVAPTVEPEAVVISASPSEGIESRDGAFVISTGRDRQAGSITFSWAYAGECDAFRIRLTKGQGAALLEETRTGTDYAWKLSEPAEGSYSFTVAAIVGEDAVAEGSYPFALSFNADGPRGGGFHGGGMRGGASSRGSASGSTEGAVEQGFTVTPGEALTSSHVSGDKRMTPYNALSLVIPEEPMTTLTVDDTALSITLDEGSHAFTAQLDGDRLTLEPEAEGETWCLNGLALRTLARSGIAYLNLDTDVGMIGFQADRLLQGEVYARLCMDGLVASDFDYRISATGIRLNVAGKTYRISESNELIPTEG